VHIKLQPDELLSGYLGRVAWANCSDTAERPLRRQLAHRGVDAEGLHPVEMVAILHAVDVERLICGHTYWALLNCVGSGSLAQQIDQGLRGSKWSTFSRRSRPGAWLCTACVEEDLEFWGFSYWRRRHQIPGLYHCDKHTVPLGVVYEEKTLSRPPHHWLDAITIADEEEFGYRENPHIARFLEVFDAVGNHLGAIDRKSLCIALRQLAGGSERHFERTAVDRRLTRLARSHLPDRWMAQALNIFAEQARKKVISCLSISGGITGQSISLVALILATCLLLESGEEAELLLQTHIARNPAEGNFRPQFAQSERSSSQHESAGSSARRVRR
jgi:hypothetical protein